MNLMLKRNSSWCLIDVRIPHGLRPSMVLPVIQPVFASLSDTSCCFRRAWESPDRDNGG